MKPYFIHSTAKSGRRFTLAAYVDNTNGYHLRIGTALCSKQDQFVKLTGRNKALGRAKANNNNIVNRRNRNNFEFWIRQLTHLPHTIKINVLTGFNIRITRNEHDNFPQSCSQLIKLFLETFAENN